MYSDLVTSAQSRRFRLEVANIQAGPGQHLYLGCMSGIILFRLLVTVRGTGHAFLEARHTKQLIYVMILTSDYLVSHTQLGAMLAEKAW